jgi:hypothetical protein
MLLGWKQIEKFTQVIFMSINMRMFVAMDFALINLKNIFYIGSEYH